MFASLSLTTDKTEIGLRHIAVMYVTH